MMDACLKIDGIYGSWANGDNLPEFTSAACTFEDWIKTDSEASQTVLRMWDSSVTNPMPRISVADNVLGTYWSEESTGGSCSSTNTEIVSGDGQWHHIAVVFEDNVATFYKDGFRMDTCQMESEQSSTSLLQFGPAIGSTVTFNGEMWNVRVWEVARDADEILESLYLELPGDYGNGLIGNLDLCQRGFREPGHR